MTEQLFDAVDAAIRLGIADQAFAADRHAAGDRRLEDRGGPAITGHRLHLTGVEPGNDQFHADIMGDADTARPSLATDDSCKDVTF